MKKRFRHILTFVLASALFVCSCMANAESETETDGNIAKPIMEVSLQEEYAEDNGLTESADALEPVEAVVPDGLDRAVIGEDNRITISSTNVYPFSAVAYLISHTRCGCIWEATGFMVGHKTMLTSAQALCCPDHGETADTIDMYFGYQMDGNYAYTYIGQFEYWYGTSFPGGYTEENASWDYGVVHLYDDVGSYTGAFGARAFSDSELDGGFYQVASYSGGSLTNDYGVSTVKSSRLFSYDADMGAGFSGSPVFDKDYNVVGIAVGEDLFGAYNWAVRITDDIIQMINESESL